MLDLSEETVGRRSKFQHRRSRLSLNQFLFVIIMATAAYDGEATTETSAHGGDGCEAFRTCAQCTADAAPCQWSFPDQKCLALDAGPPTAAAVAPASCPRFRSRGHTGNVTTTVACDGAFARFLANSSRVTCRVNEDELAGLVDADGATVHCVRTSAEYDAGDDARDDAGDDARDDARDDGEYADEPEVLCTWPSSVAYVTIAVDDGPPVVFDDARDHYALLFPARCDGRATCPDAGTPCAACQWDDRGYRHYCTWCAARGECGPYRACDRRRLTDTSRADDGDVETLRLDGRCARGLGPFRPAVGPWAGGTAVLIAVPDREALLLDAAADVTVTVAGRECTGLRWSGDAVACTVSVAPPPYEGDADCAPAAAGPVELTVGGSPGVTVRSAEHFRFVGVPEPCDGCAVPGWRPPDAAGPSPTPGPAADADPTTYGPAADADPTTHGRSASGGGPGASGLLHAVCLACLYGRVLA